VTATRRAGSRDTARITVDICFALLLAAVSAVHMCVQSSSLAQLQRSRVTRFTTCSFHGALLFHWTVVNTSIDGGRVCASSRSATVPHALILGSRHVCTATSCHSSSRTRCHRMQFQCRLPCVVSASSFRLCWASAISNTPAAAATSSAVRLSETPRNRFAEGCLPRSPSSPAHLAALVGRALPMTITSTHYMDSGACCSSLKTATLPTPAVACR
jgi:hypothetical protein